MFTNKIALGWLMLACASVAVRAQDFKSLAFLEKFPVAHSQVHGNFAVQLPMKCGPDGAIYVRFAGAGSEPAITSIGQDGKIVAIIRLSEIPEFSENDLYDFATGNGEVLVLSGHGKPQVETKYYVSRFKADGTYVSSVKVDIGFRPDFEPLHIAEFLSGDLLIAGTAKGHDVPFVPFTGIFGADGEFRRQVVLEDDVTKKDARQKASDPIFPDADRMRNLIDVSYLQTGDDGNVYLMRHAQRGPVFVVAPGGSVRRLALSPPVADADLQWIMTSGGSIAVQYHSHDPAQRKTHYLTIVDAATGKTRETIRYTHDYQINGGGMACYQHGAFTFLAGAPDNNLQLVRAVAQ
jgi:hypothetical protein